MFNSTIRESRTQWFPAGFASEERIIRRAADENLPTSLLVRRTSSPSCLVIDGLEVRRTGTNSSAARLSHGIQTQSHVSGAFGIRRVTTNRKSFTTADLLVIR